VRGSVNQRRARPAAVGVDWWHPPARRRPPRPPASTPTAGVHRPRASTGRRCPPTAGVHRPRASTGCGRPPDAGVSGLGRCDAASRRRDQLCARWRVRDVGGLGGRGSP